MCFYLVSISCNISNIGLCVSVYVSFMCNLFILILCMWYRSNVFLCFLQFKKVLSRVCGDYNRRGIGLKTGFIGSQSVTHNYSVYTL
jgi:hypothetical protein